MRELVKKHIPEKYHAMIIRLTMPFLRKYRKSYSQSGEDMVLNTIFCNANKGFYVDVGANNPKIQSNTHFFYKKGWKGINIDALPGSMKKFKLLRSRDINLEIPISDKEEVLTYYMFSPSFYNSFDKEFAETYKDKLIGTKELKTEKLSAVLDKYLKNKTIDFMSVDVEGFDLKVLKSNDWNKYRPKIIVIELHVIEKGSDREREISNFLKEKGYSFYCQSPTNAFFIENDFYNIRFKQN